MPSMGASVEYLHDSEIIFQSMEKKLTSNRQTVFVLGGSKTKQKYNAFHLGTNLSPRFPLHGGGRTLTQGQTPLLSVLCPRGSLHRVSSVGCYKQRPKHPGHRLEFSSIHIPFLIHHIVAHVDVSHRPQEKRRGDDRRLWICDVDEFEQLEYQFRSVMVRYHSAVPEGRK